MWIDQVLRNQTTAVTGFVNTNYPSTSIWETISAGIVALPGFEPEHNVDWSLLCGWYVQVSLAGGRIGEGMAGWWCVEVGVAGLWVSVSVRADAVCLLNVLREWSSCGCECGECDMLVEANVVDVIYQWMRTWWMCHISGCECGETDILAYADVMNVTY